VVPQVTRTRWCLLGLTSLLAAGSIAAQPYVEGGRTRHRFAQLTVGADARIMPAGDASTDATRQEVRAIIGGTHFWGHADFFIALPVSSSGDSPFSTRVETGARVYPWRLEEGRIRPWVGASFMAVEHQRGAGPTQSRVRTPVTAGLTYQRGPHLVSLGAGAIGFASRYPDSPTTTVPIRMHPRWFSLGYTRAFDVTLSAESGWKSGATAERTLRELAAGTLGGPTVAAGPSSAFFLRDSEQLLALGYAGQHRHAELFPDQGLGWHLARAEVQFNLAWRQNRSAVGGYGYSQEATRSAFTLEAYRFLFDYHGFVPFVGPHLSRERLQVRGSVRGDETRWRPGVTLGWDIRPDRLQSFLLRTNLRYTPGLDVTVTGGRTVAMDQLEFNFIQLVIYPRRLF